MSKRADDTLMFYAPMIRELEAQGCATYCTGSYLTNPVQNDLDIVVEVPEGGLFDFEHVIVPYGFKSVDDGDYVGPRKSKVEDVESERGIYNAPATSVYGEDGFETLPVQLLVFVKDSVAAGHWRESTRRLREDPEKYRTRAARVAMFRHIRGQEPKGISNIDLIELVTPFEGLE